MTKQELWERVVIANIGEARRAVFIADATCDAWEDRFVPKPKEKPRSPIDNYGDWLSVRTENCLKAANVLYIDELEGMSNADLLRLRNFGRKSLREVRELLDALKEPTAEAFLRSMDGG